MEEIESADLMLERIATFSEKYEFEDEFTEQICMADMMHVRQHTHPPRATTCNLLKPFRVRDTAAWTRVAAP